MNHTYLLLAFLLGGSAAGYAQPLSTGSGGMYIKSGATVVIDRLHLQPTADIHIQNNVLQTDNTPVPGNPNGSIARVYKWTDAIQTKGLVGIYVQAPELNGNTFSLLQLAYSPTDNPGDYVVSDLSVAVPADFFVFETMQPTVWKQLTAVESGSVLSLHSSSFTENAMTLGPNPTTGHFNILGLQPGKTYRVSIVAADGKPVFSERIKTTGGPYHVNATGWVSGVYYVRLDDGAGGTFGGKVLKQ